MSQCNFCGYTEPHPTDLQIGAPPRPVVPCEFCGSQICSGCRPNHEVGCRPNAQKKALGVGPTVSSVPYEHRAGHVVPETTPPDRRERVTAMPAVLGAPYELTPEPNEGPWIDHDTIGKELGIVGEKPLKIQMAGYAILETTTINAETAYPSTAGSTDSNGSDSVTATDDSGHISDASGDSGNAPSAPEPEIEMVDPATADGE
jgi:hypothetical protein